MSWAPTITVTYNSLPVDFIIYPDATEKELLFEAFRLASKYKDNPPNQISDEDQSDLNKWAATGDIPMIVDLNQHCIYHSRKLLSPSEIMDIPSIFDIDGLKIDASSDFYTLLQAYRIPYEHVDMQALEKLLQESENTET